VYGFGECMMKEDNLKETVTGILVDSSRIKRASPGLISQGSTCIGGQFLLS